MRIDKMVAGPVLAPALARLGNKGAEQMHQALARLGSLR